MTTYNIDFKGCYESFPCKHSVKIIKNGITKNILMSGPDIVRLIIEKNIQVEYDDFLHFKYLFKSSNEYNFLDSLVNKKKLDIEIIDNSLTIYDFMYKDPTICFSANINRTCVPHYKVIHKCDFINNKFIYKNNNHSMLRCNIYKVICVDELEKEYCPEKVDMCINNIFIKTWYNTCVENLDIPNGIPIINNLEIIVHDTICKNVFLQLYLENIVNEKKSIIYRNNTYELLYEGNNLSNVLDLENIYSDIFFEFNNISLAKNICLSIENLNLLMDVPISFLKLKNNICVYKFCEQNYGINFKNLKFKIISEPQYIKIYGNKQNKIKYFI